MNNFGVLEQSLKEKWNLFYHENVNAKMWTKFKLQVTQRRKNISKLLWKACFSPGKLNLQMYSLSLQTFFCSVLFWFVSFAGAGGKSEKVLKCRLILKYTSHWILYLLWAFSDFSSKAQLRQWEETKMRLLPFHGEKGLVHPILSV